MIALGLTTTFYWQIFRAGYDYRQTVAVWFRSIFYFNPRKGPDMASLRCCSNTYRLCFSRCWQLAYTRLVRTPARPLGICGGRTSCIGLAMSVANPATVDRAPRLGQTEAPVCLGNRSEQLPIGNPMENSMTQWITCS